MIIGGVDEDEDVLEELQEESASEEGAEGSCENQQPSPPQYDSELDLDEIEGRMEESPQLDMPDESSESNPSLTQGIDESPRKPKLASSNEPELIGGQNRAKDRIAGFHKRETKRSGGGKLLGGGSSGSAGFIA